MKKEDILNDKIIFIVDDELDSAESLEFLLSEYYKNIYTYKNGLEAYTAIVKDDIIPDLIISDVHMPMLDGAEMVNKLKISKYDIPIVFITAHLDAVTLKKTIETDPLRLIYKPITHVDIFVNEINSIVLGE